MKVEKMRETREISMEVQQLEGEEIKTMKEADEIFDKVFDADEVKEEYDPPAGPEISFGSSVSSS